LSAATEAALFCVGCPSFGDTFLTMRAKRPFGALLLALPVTLLATAIGDNTNILTVVKALVSPGMMIALRLDTSGERLLDAISKVVLTALFLNEVYYSLIIYGGLTCFAALRRHPSASRNKLQI